MHTAPGESYQQPLGIKRSDLEIHLKESEKRIYVVTNYQLHPRNFNRYPHHTQLALYLNEIDPQSATLQIEEIVQREIQRQQAYTNAPFLLIIDEAQNLNPAIVEAAIAIVTKPERELDFAIALINAERAYVPSLLGNNAPEYLKITN